MADAKIMTFGELFSATTDVIQSNKTAALDIEDLGGESYIKINTTTGSEAILLATGDGIDDLAGCKVGISITEPLEKLHVAAQGGNQSYTKYTNDDTQHADGDGCYVGLNSDESMRVWQREDNVLDFGTSGAFAMRIDADGDVGIGTTNPSARFHTKLTDSTDWTAKIQADGTTQNALNVITNAVTGTGITFTLGGNNTVFKNNGDVGIGTTTVAAKLDVTDGGNDYTSGLLLRNSDTSTSQATSLYHDNAGSTTTVLANRYGSDSAAIKLVLQAESVSPITALTALGNGNVGIGTTSPVGWLHVKVTDNSDYWLGKFEGVGTTQNALNVKVATTVGPGARFELGTTTHAWLNNGKVGFGNEFPTKNLSIVNPDGEGHLELRSDAQTSNAVFYLGTPFNTSAVNKTAISTIHLIYNSQSDLHFCLNSTDDNTTEVSVSDSRMMINTDGNVGVAKTPSAAVRMDVSGAVGASTGYYVGAILDTKHIDDGSNGSGSATLYIGDEPINTTSDRRIKKNIVDTSANALDTLDKVRVVDFEWDDPSDVTNGKNARGAWTGVIAQEVIDHIPYAVNAPRDPQTMEPLPDAKRLDNEGNEFDQLWLLNYGNIVPLLIKAVQELKSEIAQLKEGN